MIHWDPAAIALDHLCAGIEKEFFVDSISLLGY